MRRRSYCGEGRSCRTLPFLETHGLVCVDACDPAPADCDDPALCQGAAVGCAAGRACVAVEGEGVCLASCSAAAAPDAFCEQQFGAETTCNDATGACE